MDYSTILKSLQQASTFDLYRLDTAISNELSSPQRLKAIRNQLKIGQQIAYFDASANRAFNGHITKLGRTYVGVLNEVGERWSIPYYWLNMANADTDITNTARRGIERNALKVGDSVGFRTKDGHELYGKVVRLNPKTAGLTVNDGRNWRVAYSLLFPVIDSEGKDKSGQLFIPRAD